MIHVNRSFRSGEGWVAYELYKRSSANLAFGDGHHWYQRRTVDLSTLCRSLRVLDAAGRHGIPPPGPVQLAGATRVCSGSYDVSCLPARGSSRACPDGYVTLKADPG